MNIPLDFFEELKSQLPSAEESPTDIFYKQFIYDDKYFEIKFYKVKEYESYFWICNPNYTQGVSVNGSHDVIK